MIDGKELNNGLVAIVTAIVTGLFAWWGAARVRNENARGARESRFESKLQERYDALQQRYDFIAEELQTCRDARVLLERKYREEKRISANLLSMMEPETRKAVERWVESGFAPFDSISKRKR